MSGSGIQQEKKTLFWEDLPWKLIHQNLLPLLESQVVERVLSLTLWWDSMIQIKEKFTLMESILAPLTFMTLEQLYLLSCKSQTSLILTF